MWNNNSELNFDKSPALQLVFYTPWVLCSNIKGVLITIQTSHILLISPCGIKTMISSRKKVSFLFSFPPCFGLVWFFFSVTALLPSLLQQPARTLTYCSLRKGKRKSVKAVVKRFLRLHNGLWVRRKVRIFG